MAECEESDWDNVNLTLVSGRPISFVMDLYEPLYLDRPVVQQELFASLRPRTYDQDLAMKDAFRKARRFLMTSQNLTEDEAISLLSVAVDFGVTQVVDGNWGVHGVIRKALFAGRRG